MKRSFDIIISIGLTIALSPLMAIIALTVRLNLGSPVVFKQLRPGQHSKPFWIMKFRTMSDSRDQEGNLKQDAERLGRLGRLLRSTSLDELPSLINVIRGEMSLVGPRPLLMQYLPLYTTGQARRHDVRPGLTGWAQVNGRNALSWDEKFIYDIWYVENQSFVLDLRIIWMTVRKVLIREGINSPGEVTMPPFTGNAD